MGGGSALQSTGHMRHHSRVHRPEGLLAGKTYHCRDTGYETPVSPMGSTP